jgi:hypothetical protein
VPADRFLGWIADRQTILDVYLTFIGYRRRSGERPYGPGAGAHVRRTMHPHFGRIPLS